MEGTGADSHITLDPAKIASYCLHDPAHPEIEIAQAAHRINLTRSWSATRPDDRILEIGCGQGTCTAVLAAAAGPNGHVDAVDPGPLDYGGPYTLGQAQAHLSASEIGNRIVWHQAEPVSFLEEAKGRGEMWDVAVLAHVIWYFSSIETLRRIMTALKGRAKRVCVAEYALSATHPAAYPHVLAVLARGMLEAHRAESLANVRSPLTPGVIRKCIEETGWAVRKQGTIVPEEGLLDGHWEVRMVEDEAFLGEIEEAVQDERIRQMLVSAKAAVAAASRALKTADENVRTMDVWTAVCEEKP